MAKFSMKDYENFMEEEKRQEQLQWEVECRREFETSGSERDWYDYLAKQEEIRRYDEFNSYPEYDGYFDEDDSDLEGMSATTERISRKAVARNRHHAAEKAKRRAEKSAEILKGKFWKLYSEITSRKESNHYRSHFNERDAFIEGEYLRPNEMRRLYYSGKSASKKANISREKTA